MSSPIYEYTMITKITGYNNNVPPDKVFESENGYLVKPTLINEYLSLIEATASMSKMFAISSYEAMSKGRIGLSIIMPDGNEIALGYGDRSIISERERDYLVKHEWDGFSPINLNDVGIWSIKTIYKLYGK